MTTKLTGANITRRQIRALGIQAFECGDTTTFDITTAALDFDDSNPHVMAARQTCADKINAAQAVRS